MPACLPTAFCISNSVAGYLHRFSFFRQTIITAVVAFAVEAVISADMVILLLLLGVLITQPRLKPFCLYRN